MRILRPIEIAFKELPWIASRPLAGLHNPAAAQFCQKLMTNGYEADRLLNVLPEHKLIYITVPKSASTRIRRTLGRVAGRYMRTLKPSRRSKFRGPYGMRNMTVDSFYRLATSSDVMRFSFVRNPYARVVSCWADKFAGRPLIPGDFFIDGYLAARQHIDADLPVGADRMLSFPEFAVFAAATANNHHDIHLQAQDEILSMPGVKLDLIGKVENFNADFIHVLDYLGANDDIRREATVTLNGSRHDDWRSYYTAESAGRIYRAYEADFDRFGYARAINESGAALAGGPAIVR